MSLDATLVLYSGPLSMFGAKVEIALHEKGLPFTLVMVPFDPALGYQPRHPEVLRINPKRQVPVLAHGALELFDSTQIFEYLEDLAPAPPLWPRDALARARARRWEMESDEVYFPHVIRLMALEEQPDEASGALARSGAAAFHARLDRQLEGRDWIAGDYGYADIAIYMAALFAERKGAPVDAGCANLIAWRERMGRRPAVRRVAAAMGHYLKSIGRPRPAFLDALLA